MYYVYIMTNKSNSILYIGVTNDLARRVGEHRSETIGGFTAHYHVNKLVYYEEFTDPKEAIYREKSLKRITRAKKEQLIRTKNPNFDDIGYAMI